MTLNRRTFLNVLAASTVAAGSTVSARLLASEVPLKKVRYGGSAWLGHYPAYLAMEYGYFKEAGIEQDWQNFRSTSSRMAAFMSGDLDVGCSGIVSAMALMARGAKHFSIVAIPDSFGRVEGLLVRDSIRTFKDLKGKKIGVTFASSTHTLVLDILNQAGLNLNDVTVLNVPAPELPAAIQSGQVDAAAAWTPQFDAIRKMPGISLLADDSAFSLYKTHKVTPGPDVLIASRKFIEQNGDTLRTYLKAYFRGSEQLTSDPSRAAKTLTKLTNLPESDQIEVVKGADFYSQQQQANLLKGEYVDGLQRLADILVAQKQIDKAPDVKNWVDPSFI